MQLFPWTNLLDLVPSLLLSIEYAAACLDDTGLRKRLDTNPLLLLLLAPPHCAIASPSDTRALLRHYCLRSHTIIYVLPLIVLTSMNTTFQRKCTPLGMGMHTKAVGTFTTSFCPWDVCLRTTSMIPPFATGVHGYQRYC